MRYNFRVPLFEQPLALFIGEDEVVNFILAIKKAGGNVEASEIECDGAATGSFVWLKHPEIGVLTHELNHYVDDMFAHCDIQDPTGEVKSYTMGWLVKNVWRKING